MKRSTLLQDECPPVSLYERIPFLRRDSLAFSPSTGAASGDEHLSHLIAESTTDAFIAIDRDDLIIYWNSGAEAMFGWSRAEVLGRSLLMIVPQEHHDAHSAGLRRLNDGGTAKLIGVTIEVPACRKDGSRLPVELSLTMWKDPQGTRPAGFAAILRDISQRKELEEERNAYARRLREGLSAIKATHDGIAFTDEEGFFIFMNAAHAQMFGIEDPEETEGLHWTTLYDAAEAERIKREAMSSVGAEGTWRGEACGLHVNGSIIEQEITLSAGANGGLICITRDISARKAELRERIRTREQLLLAERQERIGGALSGLAHDFNNLMAVISASAAALEEDGGGELAPVARIQSATAAASKLLRKILKPERRTAERQTIDAAKAVADVADLVGVSLAPGHMIDVDLPDGPVHIWADESELMQVLMNLCTNARDALSPGSPGHIMLRLATTNGAVMRGAPVVGGTPEGAVAVIRVEDNGCGIPPDEIQRIFEPFVSRRKALGTGLGLAVVGRLVSEAGGCIFVESSEAGSCFQLVWPLEPREQVTIAGAATHGSSDLTGLTILAVDDNPALLDLITLHLERAGAEVCPCLSPIDGLEALGDKGASWAGIVVDYDMPKMNGVEFATLARRVHPSLPILLCSAVAEDLVLPPSAQGLFNAKLSKANLQQQLTRALAGIVRSDPTGDEE